MKPSGWVWNYVTQKFDLVLFKEDWHVVIQPTDDKYPHWITYGSEGE